MLLKTLVGAGLLALAGAAVAQMPANLDPDWRESEAPPPPQLRADRLVELEISRGSMLRFGVDPGSITVGTDGIVRYVVVARSTSGVVNAMYEGIRCDVGEVKVYARHNPDSGWVPVRDPQWAPIREVANTRHSLFIARNGACIGQGPNKPASNIARDLALPPSARFGWTPTQ